RDGDSWRASAVPVPGVAKAARLRVLVSYPEGSVSGRVEDRPIKAAGKDRKLSEVRLLRNKPVPGAEFRDGTRTSLPDGLDELAVVLGGETLKLKATGFDSASFDLDEPSVTVACTVVAKVGGKVVAEAGDTLSFGDGAATAYSPPVQEPKFDGDRIERALPAPANDAVMAGGGRYLLLMLPKLKRVEIFDVSLAKIVGHIPVAEEGAKIAGGQTKLVVMLPGEAIVQRWDIATRKRELAVPLSLRPRHTAKHVAMGCASEGPVVVTASFYPVSGETRILDLRTLKEMKLKREEQLLHSLIENPMRASADGSVIGSFWQDRSPQGVQSLVIEGGEAKLYHSGDSLGHVTPTGDGRYLCTGRGVLTREGKPVGKVGREGLYCLPAVRGPFHLGMRINGGGRAGKHTAHLFLTGETRELLPLAEVEWPEDMNEWDREAFGWDRRIWFVPEAKVLITIPLGKEKLVIRKLDAELGLEKSGVDYLLVVSRPPASAKKGAAFTYKAAAKSKKGGVKWELSSGPRGLTVSKDGEVSWKVPADFAGSSAEVVLAASDAGGKEAFHRFTLAVE
ncbi:MAG: hypothetical protein K2W96_08050, partial [Gemmataceae bacterium]|nr:hypothetical protein [Gemmataceae bacterium]